MRLLIFLLLFSLSTAQGKNHVKSLTESMGQEIIEIGTPIKAELPPGLEEEPSPELDDNESSSTQTTKRETRRATTTTPPSTRNEEIKNALSSEDEEIKVEKELSEIYKDTDYKVEATSTEEVAASSPSSDNHDKPVARARNSFKFQPDLNNKADVERFRTSVDEISCERGVTLKLNSEISSTADHSEMSIIIIGLAFLSAIVI